MAHHKLTAGEQAFIQAHDRLVSTVAAALNAAGCPSHTYTLDGMRPGWTIRTGQGVAVHVRYKSTPGGALETPPALDQLTRYQTALADVPGLRVKLIGAQTADPYVLVAGDAG